jgi:hypothetical protein
MEKMVMGFGFVMFCVCFLVGFLTMNCVLWGCLPSLVLVLVGWWFSEE